MENLKNYTAEEVTTFTANYILNNAIATEEEVNLVTSIIGYNVKTLNDILFYFTGYRYAGQEEGFDSVEEYMQSEEVRI